MVAPCVCRRDDSLDRSIYFHRRRPRNWPKGLPAVHGMLRTCWPLFQDKEGEKYPLINIKLV